MLSLGGLCEDTSSTIVYDHVVPTPNETPNSSAGFQLEGLKYSSTPPNTTGEFERFDQVFNTTSQFETSPVIEEFKANMVHAPHT